MKFEYIIHRNSPGLILFFTGWGSDRHPAGHLKSDMLDVAVIYDYRNEHLTDAAGEAFPEYVRMRSLAERYRTISLIAWSMGVWSAEHFFRRIREAQAEAGINLAEKQTEADILFKINAGGALAVNGTLFPVHPFLGIPPDIYDGTADNLPAGLEKFNLRMCGGKQIYERYMTCAPRRDPGELKQELLALRNRIADHPFSIESPAIRWKTALVSEKDRIFPTENQQAFWKSCFPDTSIIPIESAHYPFFRWTRWEELTDLFPQDKN